MSFTIGNVEWSPLEVDEAELQPIMSTLTDYRVESRAIRETGLEGSGFTSLGELYGTCREFKMGRIVVTGAIVPRTLGEAMPTQEERTRWFTTGLHVVSLTRQLGQSCYSNQRPQAAAQIFGPRLI